MARFDHLHRAGRFAIVPVLVAAPNASIFLMALFPLIFLALVQGITEFLPISSSGHLILVPVLTGWPDQGQTIDVAVHVGTLLAVMAYFRRDVGEVAMGGIDLLKLSVTPRARLALFLAVGTIPAVIAGFVLHETGTDDLMRSATVIGWTTLGFGILLYMADRSLGAKQTEQMSWRDAIIIGVAQAVALVPGTSRSGITMTAGRFLGYSRAEAARFSMLLSIPTILGAGTLAGLDLLQSGELALGMDALLALAFSGASAFIAIGLLMAWLQRATMTPFVIYRIALGVGLLSWSYGLI